MQTSGPASAVLFLQSLLAQLPSQHRFKEGARSLLIMCAHRGVIKHDILQAMAPPTSTRTALTFQGGLVL
jgi:hypothetical protein